MPAKGSGRDLTGEKFGRLTVIALSFREPHSHAHWMCRCDCGKEVTVRYPNLRNGNTKSCGCLLLDRVTKHGHNRRSENAIPEYKIWKSMRLRCNSKENKNFNRYGARGIAVCSRWDSFINFLEDMGNRPTDEHTIERINNDGNYQPSNCRWATRKEQARNTSRNRILTVNGMSLSVVEWEERQGLPSRAIANRLRIGWSVEDAVLTPPLRKYSLDEHPAMK